MRKKVGVLLTSLSGAGTEKTILTLCSALLNKGCDVTLFAIRNRIEYKPPVGVKYICLDAESNAVARKRIYSVLKPLENEFDLFLVSSTKFFDYVPVSNKVGTVHITPTAWIKNDCFDWLKRKRKVFWLKKKFKGKRMVALSEGIKNDLVENLDCNERDVTVIPNPFEMGLIEAKSDQSQRSPDSPYIVCIASLTKRKRHVDLLKAFAKMENREFKLVLVGKGPEEEKLRSLAEDLGVKDRLIFWGWTDNPYAIIKGASLSVLASEAEGSPRAVIESLLLGCPTVSTDCPSGPSEILKGELSEYLVDVGDVNALSQAMDMALDSYPDIASNVNMSRFRADVVAQRYLDLFSF